jgi:1-aminocyclopropane-1-carboxylate deaminase
MTQISKLNFINLDAFFLKQSEFTLCHFEWKGIQHCFYVLREDLLHPALSGNKFRKLYGWLQHYRSGNFNRIESMGGAHSNHMSALAYACFVLQIPCTMYVPVGSKSPLLDKVQQTDIQIQEVTREKFRALREKKISDVTDALWIPEGGKGEKSVRGFKQVAETILTADLECFVSAGTGSTASALASFGVKTNALLAVKDKSVQQKLLEEGVTVLPSYEISKFGKLHPDALSLAKAFYDQTGILLDPIYQAKGLLLLCNEKVLNEKSVFIHTGGVQGWMGYQSEFDINFPETIKKEVYANFDAIFTS